MNTTIYLVRHSEPFKIHRGIEEVEEDSVDEDTSKKDRFNETAEKVYKD